MSTLRQGDTINLKGREYVLFPALLRIATENGLASVVCETVQIPSKENGFFAVSKATVSMLRGEDIREFTCYGDASPENVSKAISSAVLRMAETRAMARAFRIALGIGQTAYDELPPRGELDDHEADSASPETPRASTPAPPKQQPAAATPAAAPSSVDEKRAFVYQVIRGLQKGHEGEYLNVLTHCKDVPGMSAWLDLAMHKTDLNDLSRLVKSLSNDDLTGYGKALSEAKKRSG